MLISSWRSILYSFFNLQSEAVNLLTSFTEFIECQQELFFKFEKIGIVQPDNNNYQNDSRRIQTRERFFGKIDEDEEIRVLKKINSKLIPKII